LAPSADEGNRPEYLVIFRGREGGRLPGNERGSKQAVGARHLSAELSPNTVLPPA